MLGVEALIVFAVASFHFAVVPRRICTDLLVYCSVYAKYSLEQCRIRLSAFVVPEVFGELLPIVRLHTFNRKLKVLNRMLQKYCGGMAAVLLKRFQIALSRELVYCRLAMLHRLKGRLRRSTKKRYPSEACRHFVPA